MTSLSEVVMKAQPFLLSSSRISAAFAMSPLWARAMSPKERFDTLVRVRPVSYHIPQAPHVIPFPLRIVEHRLERCEVGMNIGYDKDAHTPACE